MPSVTNDLSLWHVREGVSSSGKTWMACAFGTAVFRAGYRVKHYKLL